MIDLNPFVFEIVVLCWADKESPFWRGVWSVVLKKDDVNMQVLLVKVELCPPSIASCLLLECYILSQLLWDNWWD